VEVFPKLKPEVPYDAVIPCLHHYPKELKPESQRGICAAMFLVALFTIATMWKQCKCPSTDKENLDRYNGRDFSHKS
jgi:hypothetical protein